MKITINKKKSDPIADAILEAKKSNRFDEFSRDSKMRLNFGIEVYNKRKELGLSQEKLAKAILSTQKVISKIENGSVDIQSSTINKINGVLKFSPQQWSRIYDFKLPKSKISVIRRPASLLASKIDNITVNAKI